MILYKVILKIVVNRLHPLMGHLTSSNQANFVMGRNIGDNIVVAHEAIHSLRNFKGNKVGMALKIDLKKAYDRIR